VAVAATDVHRAIVYLREDRLKALIPIRKL